MCPQLMRSDYVNVGFTNGLSWPVMIRSMLKAASHSETGMTSDSAVVKLRTVSKRPGFLLPTFSFSEMFYPDLQRCHLRQESKEMLFPNEAHSGVILKHN